MTDLIAFTTLYHYDNLYNFYYLSSKPKKLDWFFCLVDIFFLIVFTFFKSEFFHVVTAENLIVITGSHYLSLFLVSHLFLWLFVLIWKVFYVFWKYPKLFFVYVGASMVFYSNIFLYTRIQ